MNLFIKFITLHLILFAAMCTAQVLVQPQIENIEKTEISGGAEFNIMLEEAIRNGNVDMFRYFGQSPPPHRPLHLQQ